MQAKILIVMAAAIVAALMCAGACFAEEAPRWAKEIGTRNRAAAAEAKFNELFKGGDGDFYKTAASSARWRRTSSTATSTGAAC